MIAKDKALERFNQQGPNCAQAVLTAHGPELGVDEKTCLTVASCRA